MCLPLSKVLYIFADYYFSVTGQNTQGRLLGSCLKVAEGWSSFQHHLCGCSSVGGRSRWSCVFVWRKCSGCGMYRDTGGQLKSQGQYERNALVNITFYLNILDKKILPLCKWFYTHFLYSNHMLKILRVGFLTWNPFGIFSLLCNP